MLVVLVAAKRELCLLFTSGFGCSGAVASLVSFVLVNPSSSCIYNLLLGWAPTWLYHYSYGTLVPLQHLPGRSAPVLPVIGVHSLSHVAAYMLTIVPAGFFIV